MKDNGGDFGLWVIEEPGLAGEGEWLDFIVWVSGRNHHLKVTQKDAPFFAARLRDALAVIEAYIDTPEARLIFRAS